MSIQGKRRRLVLENWPGDERLVRFDVQRLIAVHTGHQQLFTAGSRTAASGMMDRMRWLPAAARSSGEYLVRVFPVTPDTHKHM